MGSLLSIDLIYCLIPHDTPIYLLYKCYSLIFSFALLVPHLPRVPIIDFSFSVNMPSYKLYYFPARAVGEVIRQIFAYAGVEYEDNRVDHAQWADFKSKTTFGQMPVLEVDGKMIPQSYAIARYLASQHGLTGKDSFEAAWVDAIADQYKDYLNEFRNFWYVLMGYREGDVEALKKEFGEPARDKFYDLIEKQLKDNKSGFLVGEGVTWADFLIADHVVTVQTELPGFLDAYPEVKKHAAKVQELPAIKAWIAKRPVTRG